MNAIITGISLMLLATGAFADNKDFKLKVTPDRSFFDQIVDHFNSAEARRPSKEQMTNYYHGRCFHYTRQHKSYYAAFLGMDHELEGNLFEPIFVFSVSTNGWEFQAGKDYVNENGIDELIEVQDNCIRNNMTSDENEKCRSEEGISEFVTFNSFTSEFDGVSRFTKKETRARVVGHTLIVVKTDVEITPPIDLDKLPENFPGFGQPMGACYFDMKNDAYQP